MVSLREEYQRASANYIENITKQAIEIRENIVKESVGVKPSATPRFIIGVLERTATSLEAKASQYQLNEAQVLKHQDVVAMQMFIDNFNELLEGTRAEGEHT